MLVLHDFCVVSSGEVVADLSDGSELGCQVFDLFVDLEHVCSPAEFSSVLSSVLSSDAFDAVTFGGSVERYDGEFFDSVYKEFVSACETVLGDRSETLFTPISEILACSVPVEDFCW